MTTYKRPTFFDRDLKAFAELSSDSGADLGLVMRSLLVESLATVGTTDSAGSVSVKNATDLELIKLDGANASIQHGTGSVASGNYAYAGGAGANASGYASHAEGGNTTASGISSHAEGYGTTASGDQSHAEGDSTTASGAASHAEGFYTQATGDYSHASGNGTIAAGYAQTVVGKYNVDANTTSLFVVGNGADEARADAFRVDPALVKSFVPVEAQSQITIGTDSTNGYLAVNDSDGNEVFTLDAVDASLVVGGRGSAKNASVALQNASNTYTIMFQAEYGRATLGSLDGMAPQAGTLLVADSAGSDKIQLFGETLIARIGNINIDGDELGESKISGLTTAMVTAEGDAATKGYVDAVAQGLVIKAACHVSSQANIAALATATVVDGHTLLEDERVLVRFQDSAIENGIYRFNGTGLVRAADMAVGSHAAGSFTFIQFGTNEDSGFVCTADAPADVVGTDALPWVQFSSAGVIEAGDGLQKIGNTISVKLDGSTLSVSPDGSKVLGVPALFTIDGTAVGSSVVAPALDTLTLGAASNANALHSHSADAEYLPPAVGLAAGQAAIINASSEAEAAGTTSTGAYMVGVVESIADGFARIVRGGLAAGVLTGATAGDVYYVQADGTLAVTLPASGRVVMAGVAKSATDLHVQVRDFGNILAA